MLIGNRKNYTKIYIITSIQIDFCLFFTFIIVIFDSFKNINVNFEKKFLAYNFLSDINYENYRI
jgi:hypothetical protein